MERWFSPELGRLFALLGIGFLSISTVMGLLIAKVKGSFKPFSKATIFYLLIYAVVFGASGFLAGVPAFNAYLPRFISFQGLFLGLGVLHVYTMQQKVPWTGSNTFWAELLFTIAIMLLGGLFFVMAYRLVNREGLELAMAASGLCFLIPHVVFHTYKKAISIPPEIMREWAYPVHEMIGDPDEKVMRNLLVISFEFQKNPGEKYLTNFRAKAPADLEFGTLFYYFINDYNERHINSPISFISERGEPYGWIFYKKPRWYNLLTRYINTDKTVFINNIKEDDVIVCVRNS